MKVFVHGSGHLAEITTAHVKSLHHQCMVASEAEIVWCCEDVNSIHNHARAMEDIRHLVHGNKKALFLISSQLPAGTIRKFEQEFQSTVFACCPENFKSTDTAEAYRKQERFVIGIRDTVHQHFLAGLFSFSTNIVWMSIESAELVKHAINAYLGMCIAFINEIQDVAKAVGADIDSVEQGLRTEPRVSVMAPLHAGHPFSGGHIDRDLDYLNVLCPTTLMHAIQVSNNRRKL